MGGDGRAVTLFQPPTASHNAGAVEQSDTYDTPDSPRTGLKARRTV